MSKQSKVLILMKSFDVKRSKVKVIVQFVFPCRCLPLGDCLVRIERIKKWGNSTGSRVTV